MKLAVIVSFFLLVEFSTQQILSPVKGCSDAMNLILVVDAEGNVPGYSTSLPPAVRDFVINTFSNNPAIRIGLVYYTNQPFIPNVRIFNLAGVADQNNILNFIQNQFVSASGIPNSRTDAGLNMALSMLRSSVVSGLASIVVITDSVSAQSALTASAAAVARAAGVRMYGVAFAQNQAVFDDLRTITVDEDMVFTPTTTLYALLQQLSDNICAYSVCTSCTVDEGSRRAAHPGRCDKFYICERRTGEMTRAFLKNCPLGTLWHRRYLTCMKAYDVLSSTSGGCDYCTGARNTYRVNDHCQIYYRCGTTATGLPDLNINCCPTSQSYDFNTGFCIPSGVCAARNYADSTSCRAYFSCGGITSQRWQTNCCGSDYYNADTQTCVVDSNCKGDCTSATYRRCQDFRSHADQCKFYSVVGDTLIEMRCANLTSWSSTECQCVNNNACVISKNNICSPSVLITVTPEQQLPTGFQEQSIEKRYIDVTRVGYSDGNIVLRGRRNFITVPYFANNDQAYIENTVFFRINVNDDFINGFPNSNNMVVLSNFPCEKRNSEAKDDASVEIKMQPSIGTVTFRVRTTTDISGTENPTVNQALLTIQYPTNLGANVWKRLTLRYSQNPGVLEADVLLYSVNPDRSRLDLYSRKATQPLLDRFGNPTTGRILTSAEATRIGKGSDEASTFLGLLDDILFYDRCETNVPAVDSVSLVTSVTTG